MAVKTLPTYDYSIAEEAATVEPKNFMSLFNPLGSGKVLIFGGVFTSATNLQTANSANTLRGWRISAASGGVLVDEADIARFDTLSYPAPVAEVRTGNPTVTLGQPLLNHPAPVANRISDVTATTGIPGSPFKMYPGQGMVLRMEAGTVDIFWNISLVWVEAS